jgi:hypothetical protein
VLLTRPVRPAPPAAPPRPLARRQGQNGALRGKEEGRG